MTTTEVAAGYGAADAQRLRLMAICRQLGHIAGQIGNSGAQGVVTALLDRMDSDAFHVMVVGDFNRGKSTFVNALLGAKVLPVKATPATAVITEVRFGESPAARLWREGSAEPEIVHTDELTALITVNSKEPDQRNPFVMAEVTWPLELCRHNVVLVDSPGLNDDVNRDQITFAQLLKADAVIFLQHAIAPMSISESDFLRDYLDAHDPFFVFTYFDAIEEAERDDVVAGARQRIIGLRGDDRDESRFFFVDAKSALRARVADDAGRYADSGVADLEQALERYLVTDRHKVKILAPARALRGLARELDRNIPHELELVNMDAADLERCWEAAQQPLRELEAQARQISLDIQNQTRILQDRVETLLGGYLASVSDEAPAIAAEVPLTTKLTLNPLQGNVAKRAEQVTQEIAAGTARAVEEKVAEWVTGSLEPVILQDLEKLAERMNAQLDSFEAHLDELRISLTGVRDAGRAGERQEEQPITRFLSGAAGLLLGGVAGGVVGARFGAKEALRTVPITLAMYCVWMLTPFGVPTLILAAVVHACIKSRQAGGRLETKMREAVGSEMATQIRLAAPKRAREAAQAFAAANMEPITREVTEGLTSRIRELTRSVESAQEVRRQGESRVEERRAELKQLEALLRGAGDDLGDLVEELQRL
ncbi:dynamin family protein [Streptomyces sp. ISL-1]|uniref:dynamin family protein n=1 Tax=Streptomyces sp. ISL-1 TaxID=2817657 RepID=UPI001BEB8AF2|nr:dynamin family protein [Streptomyces sp. ISL-1]MBT2389158.1 dynamin family protein [Streptomyces sp. ISL-1]